MSGGRRTEVAQRVARFEIAASDLKATRDFYSALFGWKIRSDRPDEYGVVETGHEVDGLIVQAERGVPTFVTFYVEVDDLDAQLQKAEDLGAVIYVPPTESPVEGERQFAVIGDLEGNLIGLVERGSR